MARREIARLKEGDVVNIIYLVGYDEQGHEVYDVLELTASRHGHIPDSTTPDLDSLVLSYAPKPGDAGIDYCTITIIGSITGSGFVCNELTLLYNEERLTGDEFQPLDRHWQRITKLMDNRFPLLLGVETDLAKYEIVIPAEYTISTRPRRSITGE